jgi:threonine dehydrogenase-like Zn-dependent dehydrogenase
LIFFIRIISATADLELLAGVVDPAYVRYLLVPGHEWSGVIEAVGPGMTGLQSGQPMIAKGIIPDRVCAECVQGHTNLCVVYDELGFMRVGAAGDGTLALITAHLLRLYSPAELIVCGQRPAQAGLAAELGATGFTVGTLDTHFDLVIEAAGTAGAVERALSPARRAGRVVLVGLAGNDVKAAFGIDDAVNNDLLISASFAYTSAAFAKVTALLSSGQISPAPLITHRFPLEAYEEAYQVLRESSGPRGKVMLDITPEDAL